MGLNSSQTRNEVKLELDENWVKNGAGQDTDDTLSGLKSSWAQSYKTFRRLFRCLTLLEREMRLKSSQTRHG